MISVTYETSSTLRGASGVTLQLHQILRLPRKMNLRIDQCHRWNVQYNARSNRRHPPTSPNTDPARKNESQDWSASHMKRPVQCTEQQESPSNFTKYCACHEKWLSWLILVTYETLFTMRGATLVTVQHHQILRLPRKMTLMIDPRRIWNLIYNARSNTGYRPTSPNTAPATKFWRQDQRKIPELLQYKDDSAMIRPWSEHIRTYLISHPPLRRPYSFHLADAFCMEKNSRSGYLPKFHELLRLPRKVTLQLHQILRLPRKVTLMINPRHIWNVIYNARSNRSHPPTSPNTAPATKNESRHIWNVIYNARSNTGYRATSPNTAPATKDDSHDWSSSHMKRHLQCAEKQESSSNFTKYCACHERWLSWLILVTYSMWFTMRGATLVTVQHHQILRLPRKMTLMIDPRHIWNLIYNARSNTGYRPTSPNTAPATKFWDQDISGKSLNCFRQYKDDFDHDPNISEDKIVISHPPLRRPYSFHLANTFCMENTTFRAPAIYQNFTKRCACHEKWRSSFTKYFACHEKCLWATFLCATLLWATLLWATLLWATLLWATLLWATLLWATLLWPTVLWATLVWATLLWATLLSATLLWATLLCATLLWATLLWATLLWATLLWATLLWATLLWATLLRATLHSATLLLYSELLYSELLYSERLYSELLYSELLCSELLYSELFYSELLYSELLYSELLYSELLYSELLDCCDFKTS